MKTILRRKDKTSIFCPSINKRHSTFTVKTKVIEFTIACTILVVGIFIMIFVQ
jgi:cell division protein FtsL